MYKVLFQTRASALATTSQGDIHFGTARLKHFLELPARRRLGTRWAKYLFSRCRYIRRLLAAAGGCRL